MDSTRGRLALMCTASLLLHLVFTPLPSLLGLISLLPSLEIPPAEELVEIELTSLPFAPPAPTPEPTAVQSPEQPPETAAQPEEKLEPLEPKKKAPKDKTISDPIVPPVEKEPAPQPVKIFGDPVALAGSAGEIADSNANVRIMLYTNVVRNHPLGTEVASLLKRTPQWRDFFGPSGVDPIADIDRVMITGPQLRNSSQIVAVVEHHMKKKEVELAFNHLVQKSGGKWLERKSLLAQARADRAERVFFAPNDKLVVVAPKKLLKQVRGLDSKIAFPKTEDQVVLTAYFVTPHRPFKDVGIEISETIQWCRIDLRPLPGGGAKLKILAQEKDEASARQSASTIHQLIFTRTTFFGQSMLKSVRFEHKNDQVLGEIEVTRFQLGLAAGFIADLLPPGPRQNNVAGEPSVRDGASKTEKPTSPAALREKKNAPDERSAAPLNKPASVGNTTSDRSAGSTQPPPGQQLPAAPAPKNSKGSSVLPGVGVEKKPQKQPKAPVLKEPTPSPRRSE